MIPLILLGIVGFVLIGWVLWDEWLTARRSGRAPHSWTF